MKKSLTKLIGITLLAVSMTLTSLPLNARAAEPINVPQNTQVQTIDDESKSQTFIESEKSIAEEVENTNYDKAQESQKESGKLNQQKEIEKSDVQEKNEEKELSNTSEIDKSINEENEITSIENEISNIDKIEKEETTDITEATPIEVPNLAATNITEGNDYPIVLVHGFLGFGRDELLGYKYWGGVVDIQEKLRDLGHETYTATVGPVSSNWDRACELYAYIVGGTVDYGEAHARKFGHERYGRTYPGVYKKISNENKIHLMGHSMGGQTIRTLTQLLSEGCEEEKACGQENLSPLFEGGKHWIHSVTTISTPNNGTTLADAIPGRIFLSSAFGVLGTVTGHNNFINSLYDFKLDQWGLKKEDGDSKLDYIDKVLNSDIWDKTKDIATYDLSTEGARELNKWVKAQPDVYYFSWSTCATRESLISDHSMPQIGPMNPLFYPTATEMGRYTRNRNGLPIIDKKWFPNDGVVNTYSQDGPKVASDDIIEKFNGQAKKGQWNVMPKLINTDHMDIVGTFGDVKDWYADYAEQLSNLPK
ncbi:esterase/lipase family protein [Clostridium weizhouense]|uniref:triacylglycerol lipase n=1 Tax=Clostridium weizhouense TaxID=2859781 RepID=A0ABS7AND3_9CLOT|nr:lipase [Clostridium weizhouense]MBW6410183.1 lipase [Clostridium weizhouense]